MKANAATMSCRRMLTTMPAAVAITGGTLPASAADDPVFAAIERHRQAVQARDRYNEETKGLTNMTRAEIKRDDAMIAQFLEEEGYALYAWVTTQPTTMAGVIATLEHAVVKNGDPEDPCYRRSEDPTNLFEGAEGSHEAFEQFPAMIATALREIVADNIL